jgi:hypothetical protein
MTLLSRPVDWVGSRGTAAAVTCTAFGLLFLLLATTAWETVVESREQVIACARAALPGHACESPGVFAGGILSTLFGPLLGMVGLAVVATGAACLLRPRGRLDANGQRLLEDATRHHASGGLSPEGFQATRDRLHARAAGRTVPQVALALSLWGGGLALLTFVLAGSFLEVTRALRGLDTVQLPATRAILGTIGACTVAALAAASVVLAQAARWRARARVEASALQQMLGDLESDILDEVRRSAPDDDA